VITPGQLLKFDRIEKTESHAGWLSILHLAPRQSWDRLLQQLRDLEHMRHIEHLVLCEDERAAHEFSRLNSSVRAINADVRLGIPALAYDLGIRAARGEWIWLWGVDSIFSPSDLADISKTLSTLAHLIWLQPPGDPSRASDVTIDQLYNGLCPAPDSIIWRADLFDRWGCFDPHLAIRHTFAGEMLFRVIRHSRLQTLPTRDGTPAIYDPRQIRALVMYADSRAHPPTFDTLAHDTLDDLHAMERRYGKHVAWQVYLEKILPYYYSQRSNLPKGLFISPQSVPFKSVHALATKVRYETSNELTFGNYERHFQGTRGFALTYLQSESLKSKGRLDWRDLGDVQVLVSTRSANDLDAALVEDANAAGLATAYLLDDDLVNFHAYGGNFAAFKPGNPFYEAMLRTIQSVDVVIGFSESIENSVAPYNRRYVACEDSVPWKYLPVCAEKNSAARPFRFGYAGGGYRTAEFEMLRPAIERICAEYGDAVQFSLWGMDPNAVAIQGNVEYVPFSIHYFEYLERLRDAKFDAMLVPLMLDPAPKRAKNPNKFMEAVIANAVGLYSDVPSYQVVQPNITGLRVAESSEAWYAALKAIIEMPEEQRARIRSNALDYVRTFYSTPALAMVNETGLLAAQLHQKTRASRGEDGRPLVAFFFPCVTGTGGGEIQLWRRFEMARKLGFRLLVVISSAWTQPADGQRISKYLDEIGVEYEFIPYNAFFTTPETSVLPSEGELIALREFFNRRGKTIALAHSLALLPAVGMVCSEFDVPHLASIYGIDDDYKFLDGELPFKYCDLIQSDSIRYAKQWSELLGCDWLCAREMAPADLFDLGFQRLYANPSPMTDPVRLSVIGTFTKRKSQLEMIQAFDHLPASLRKQIELHFYGGVDVYPPYGAACRQAKAHAGQAGAKIFFHGHVTDITQIYQSTDIVLSISTLESFPAVIKEATAAGCLVIASHAGGITEMMVDDVNCFLVNPVTPDTIANAIARALSADMVEVLTIRRNAYQMAYEEFHPRRTIHDLALMYNLCIDSARKNPASPSTSAMPTPVSVVPITPTPVPSVPSEPQIPITKLEAVGENSGYRVVPSRSDWSGLDVNVEKQQHQWAGVISLIITTENGTVLRRMDAELGHSLDYRWFSFRFDPIINSANTHFNVRFKHVHRPIVPTEPPQCRLYYDK
jgi:glycosyltransferase involved in cell wall biosynthesis